tara:strand:- start:468 stop:1772 length:1305 start_codon:yes stop_codon:yes gene_type:complete
VNKIFKIFIFILFTTNCSLDKNSSLWSKKNEIKKENVFKTTELFQDDKALENEFNSNVRLQLSGKPYKNSYENSLTNNVSRFNYDGNLKTSSRFKFSKIDNFHKFEPDIIFENKNIIFFNNKGTILKFNENSKLVWKKNHYNKAEKKLKPLLNMKVYKNYLIVADNIAKYYAVDVKNGNLLWTKNNSSPFNSEIKIYKKNFFVIDAENILRCFSLKNGVELWNVKTDKSFVKSQKKLSLIILNETIYFNNTLGDITAVDINTGKLIWQTPTQDSSIYQSSFYLKTSELVGTSKSLFFSNNMNEFYSIDPNTGTLIWKQKINSSIKPSVVDNLIFTISEEGFLIVIDKDTGNIIRITNVFNQIKKKKRSKIKPIGFILGKKNIYLSISNGRLIIIDIITGKSKSILKIDNERISRPFVLNNKLFIIKDSAIIKLD